MMPAVTRATAEARMMDTFRAAYAWLERSDRLVPEDQPCPDPGTRNGLGLHLVHRTPFCRPCLFLIKFALSVGLDLLGRVKPGCGTQAGYSRHRRAKEDPCLACRTKHRLIQREWRAASRGEVPK